MRVCMRQSEIEVFSRVECRKNRIKTPLFLLFRVYEKCFSFLRTTPPLFSENGTAVAYETNAMKVVFDTPEKSAVAVCEENSQSAFDWRGSFENLKVKFDDLENKYAQLENRAHYLEEQLRWFRRQMFGAKSEKTDPNQLMLALGEIEREKQELLQEARREKIEYTRVKMPRTARNERLEKFLETLPVAEEQVIEPEEVLANPEGYKQIGAETKYELDVVPPHYRKVCIIRPKYVAKGDRTTPPVVAPVPARPVQNSHVTPGTIAWFAQQKFQYHLPLYRLEKISGQMGFKIARRDSCEWLGQAAWWLKSIYKIIKQNALAGGYIEIDETPVKYIPKGCPENAHGKTKEGRLWVLRNPASGEVVFDWQLSRKYEALINFIGEGYEGLLHSDGYKAYPRYAEKHSGKVTWLACWAHARREFFESQKNHPQEAAEALKLIGDLYEKERACTEKADAEGVHDAAERARRRRDMRQKEFPPILGQLKEKAYEWQKRVLPQSRLGKAITYLLNQWEALVAHLEHGETRLDTNGVEGAIRPSALGKKNWLFIGSPEAGERSAIFYTLAANCQAVGVDYYEYLKDVLTRLPALPKMKDCERDYASFTPSNWKKSREEKEAGERACAKTCPTPEEQSRVGA